MGSILGFTLLLVVLGIHALVAAVLTRFLRIRLSTRWGTAVYTAFLVPVVLLASTLVFTGPLGIGVDLGSPATVLTVMILLPAALGIAVDFLYVEPPDEYELPEPAE